MHLLALQTHSLLVRMLLQELGRKLFESWPPLCTHAALVPDAQEVICDMCHADALHLREPLPLSDLKPRIAVHVTT